MLLDRHWCFCLVLTVVTVTFSRKPPTSVSQYKVNSPPVVMVTLVPAAAPGQEVAVFVEVYVGGACAEMRVEESDKKAKTCRRLNLPEKSVLEAISS
jgi:hypothetical protein